MATTITTLSEIPNAPFYVITRDTFMSGWGQAKGLSNKLILPCLSIEEAEIVLANAKARGDQSNVTIINRKPRLTGGVLWQVMEKTRSTNRWYEPGGFE